MCSPSPKKEKKPPAASTVTPAKKNTPAKKKTPAKAKYPKSPRGLPNNMKLLSLVECRAVEKFLEKHPGFEGRHTFNDLPGKPHVTLTGWDVDASAPFGIVLRGTRSKYIPPGHEGNKYLLNLIIVTTKEKGFDVNDPEFLELIMGELSNFAIAGGVDRIAKLFKSATLVDDLDNYAAKEDVQAVLNQIHARFLGTDERIANAQKTADDAKVVADDAQKTAAGAKVVADDAKKNAVDTETKSLLNLRPMGLNRMLRTASNNVWANVQAAEIDSYLQSLPVYKGVCYRGVNCEGLPGPFRQTWFVAGNLYVDAAFTTASLSPDVAWKYAGPKPFDRVVFEITSYTGRLVPVGDEQEVSFKHGTKFTITSAAISYPHDDNRRHIFVRMEEYDDDL